MPSHAASTNADKPDINHYTYSIRWDDKIGQFIATAAELPDLRAQSVSQVEALVNARLEAQRMVDTMLQHGQSVPIPFSERTYSGKILVRIPPELHRRLTIEAAEQHVSLNRLISMKLAGE